MQKKIYQEERKVQDGSELYEWVSAVKYGIEAKIEERNAEHIGKQFYENWETRNYEAQQPYFGYYGQCQSKSNGYVQA